MGIRSTAIFSDCDADFPFVNEADSAYSLGGNTPADTYLNQEKILHIARRAQVDAIHPGYGFLSENADFARACSAAGFIFIGPSPEAIASMGSKATARGMMMDYGIPVVPGYNGDEQEYERFREEADKIGYPVLVKAAFGGGGRGMRIVREQGQLESALRSAGREAKRAFGNDKLILEKYIDRGRHIEVQVIGDQYGKLIHLFERECTIQRRHQKIIEECPSPYLTPTLRSEMTEMAVRAAESIGYSNAGTVEFIVDEGTGSFYFLEMNTRLQVEHPVTEMVTGVDLVQLQIECAEGRKLRLNQDDVAQSGYAIECRLYAENPLNDFMPVTGRILYSGMPSKKHVRCDSAIRSGTEISIHYDSMLAKLISWGRDRAEAHRRMKNALSGPLCLGLDTNRGFLCSLMDNELFSRGEYDVHFVESLDLSGNVETEENTAHLAAIGIALAGWENRRKEKRILQNLSPGWRNNPYNLQRVGFSWGDKEILVCYGYQDDSFHFEYHGKESVVVLRELGDNHVLYSVDGMLIQLYYAQSGTTFFVQFAGSETLVLESKSRFPSKTREKSVGRYEAAMPSEVLEIFVKPGQEIQEGEVLMVLSSMKIEKTVLAHSEGTIAKICVSQGAHIEAGTLLLEMDGESLAQ
jgi:3-methylcrotonyl-CoA carboxylase alpha subunit